jgi:hypothetical protein
VLVTIWPRARLAVFRHSAQLACGPCLALLRPGTIDSKSAIWARRYNDGVNGAMLAKALIVMVAFPVLTHMIFTVSSKVLGLVLPPVLSLTGGSPQVLANAILVGTMLLAIVASYRVCRRLWPTPRVHA